MSQVRKLKQGDKFEKTYKILFDGQEYTINDDQLSRINEGIANLDTRYKQYLGGISNSIQSGNFVGDDIQNAMSLDALTNLNNRERTFLSKGKKNMWEAITDGPTYQAKEAINAGLKVVRNVINSSKSNTSSNTSKTKISGDEITLDFNQDGDGKYYLSPTAGQNLNAKTRVNQILDHLRTGDASIYDVDGWDLAAISNWINGIENNADLEGNDKYEKAVKYFSNLWTNLDKNNKKTLSPDDIDLLANFRIIGTGNPSGGNVSTTEVALKNDFKDNPNLYKIIQNKYVKGDDGVWRLKEGETPIDWSEYGIELNPGQGAYFNDDFYNSSYGVDGRLNALKGLTFYNNAIYNINDPTLKRILDTEETGYNALMKQGKIAAANNIIRTNWTTNSIPELTAMPGNKYSSFLSDKPYLRFSNLTGAYTLPNRPLVDGEQLIQYIDLNNPIVSDNPYTDYQMQFAILDKNGNLVPYDGDILSDDLQETGQESAGELRSYNRIYNSGNSDFEGMYYEDFGDAENQSTRIRIFRSPNDPNKVILQLPTFNGRRVGQNAAIELPEEIAKIILSNPNLITQIAGDKGKMENFIDILSRLTTSGFRNNFNKRWFLPGPDLLINKSIETKQLRDMGFSPEQAEALYDALKSAKKEGGNTSQRISKHVKYAPSMQKNGGKLEHVEKLLKGGKSKGNTQVTSSASTKLNVKNQTLGNAASITEMGTEAWGKEDTADLVALAADLTSMGVTLADPTNIGGALTGVAGSLARFKADTTRHRFNPEAGKGAGWNLALNLGMDALTLLPVAGDAAAVVKNTNNIRKHLPTLLKVMSLVGMGDAAGTITKKLANNEKLTVRDLSLIANAVTAGVALSRTGGFGKSKTTPTTKGFKSEKVKVGDAESELDSDAISRIMKSSDKEDAIKKELRSLFGEEASTEAIDKEASRLLKTKKNAWQKLWGKDGKGFKAQKESKNGKPEDIESNGNWLHDWWHGVGDKRAAYLAQLRGEKTPTRIETTPGTRYTRTDIAEAPGTTAGGRYYTDEFNTSYLKGPVSTTKVPANRVASEVSKLPANHRTGIMDEAGNFTGKVRVETIRPGVENIVPLKTWNHWAVPQILFTDHTTNGLTYQPLPGEEQVVGYQRGGSVMPLGKMISTMPIDIRTIVRRKKKNGESSETVYEGDVPDDKVLLMQKLNQQQPLQANYGDEGQLLSYTVPDEEIVITREEVPPQKPLKPILGPEGKIVGWHVPEDTQETPKETPEETPEETPAEIPSQNTVYESPNNGVTIAIPKPERPNLEQFEPKFEFLTEKFGIKNPTITSLDDIIVPLSKQKIKKFKTKNNNVDMAELVDAVRQLAENNNVVIKGQSGLSGLNPNWKPKIDWNPYLEDKTQYPALPDWSVPTIKQQPSPFNKVNVNGALGMNDFEMPSMWDKMNKTSNKNDSELAKGVNYNLPDVSRWLLPGLSVFRYFDTLRNQKKYRDTDIKRINAARYNETPVEADLARTDNPVLDRALRQVNEERMSGMKPVTSDAVVNEALKRQRDSQLLNRERDLITSLSESYQQKELENLNISNQNKANRTLTANQNAARNASINSALYNPELEYLLRRDASNQAATIELQNNLKQDRATMLELAKSQYQTKLTNDYNNNVDLLFPGARAAYNNLSATEAAKYYDFEDYLKQTRPDEWAKNKDQIDRYQSEMMENMRKWVAYNGLSGYTPSIIFGKKSTVGVDKVKKGGRLNGKTRYTLEPDERVWIDNNKAAHNQIAKLSDATVKLLLRALK